MSKPKITEHDCCPKCGDDEGVKFVRTEAFQAYGYWRSGDSESDAPLRVKDPKHGKCMGCGALIELR